MSKVSRFMGVKRRCAGPLPIGLQTPRLVHRGQSARKRISSGMAYFVLRCLPAFLIEIPSALAFRSIVMTDVLNLAAICDAVALFAAIAITRRSAFQVKRPDRLLSTIEVISSPSAQSRPCNRGCCCIDLIKVGIQVSARPLNQ